MATERVAIIWVFHILLHWRWSQSVLLLDTPGTECFPVVTSGVEDIFCTPIFQDIKE